MTVLILASPADAITINPDVEVKLVVGGRAILEHGEPFARVAFTDTKVERSPVADGFVAIAPLAGLLNGDTLVVYVVLSSGHLAQPLEVMVTVGTSQWLRLTTGDADGDGLAFGACARSS